MLQFRRTLQVFRSELHLLHQQLIDYDLKFSITVVNSWLFISCLNQVHSQPRSHGLSSIISPSLSPAGNEVGLQLFSVTRSIATITVVSKSHHPEGQPGSTKNESPSRAYVEN